MNRRLLLAMPLKSTITRNPSFEDMDLASEIEVFKTVVLEATTLPIRVLPVKIAE